MPAKFIALEPEFERAFVTGGGSGIGRGVALSLAQAGCTVFVMGRRLAPLQETARQAEGAAGRIVPITGDIRDADSVDRAFHEAEGQGGPTQLLYQSAASLFHSEAVDMHPSDFAALVQGSLIGAFNVIHRWGTALVKAKLPGAAAVVTSANGERESPGNSASGAAKTGLEAFCRTVAREWGEYGLRVNVIGPGAFLTEGLTPSLGSDEVRKALETAAALRRYGDMREIIEPSIFLLSKASSYMTGDVMRVDGGYRLSGYKLGRNKVQDGVWTHKS